MGEPGVITYYLLLITYYSLLITHYLLLITYYLLLPVRPFKIELEEMLLRGKRLTTKLSVNSSWELK